MNTMDRGTLMKMARELREVAMEASLTGSLRKGSSIMVGMYNRCVAALKEQGDTLAEQLFPPLPEATTTVDEVGAAAALLYGYLRPARPVRRHRDEERDEEEDED